MAKEKHAFDVSTAEGQRRRLMAESVGAVYVPRRAILAVAGDYGADPIGDGTFRMVPSGDIVDYAERCKRLTRVERW